MLEILHIFACSSHMFRKLPFQNETKYNFAHQKNHKFKENSNIIKVK
jgi:hypothetical protein